MSIINRICDENFNEGEERAASHKSIEISKKI